ncbi:MAG: LCP family protein [Candidatus Caenarcaniphilales bacterium]|nr:LCP family protein [Candidatus Caenarcaniphilales bacterium]
MASDSVEREQTNTKGKKENRKNNYVFDLVLFSLIIILLFGFTYSHRYSNRSYGNISQTNLLDTLSFYTLKKPVTILLAGADQEYEFADDGYAYKVPNHFHGRTDTIILAKFDPVQKTISALNIPRDTKIFINGKRPEKINAINTIKGPELLQKLLEDLLDVHIDKYVIVSTEGIVKLIDEVGGIPVNVDKKMVYHDKTDGLYINLEPGLQTLNGKQAIGFLRFRKDNWGDIGRIQRQQQFIRAVKKKLSDPYLIPQIPKLTSMILENVLTDLTVPEMLKLANFVRTTPQEAHIFSTLPGTFSMPEIETKVVYEETSLNDLENSESPIDISTHDIFSEISEADDGIPDNVFEVDEETGELVLPKVVTVQKPFISYWLPNETEIKKVVKRLFGEAYSDGQNREINPRRIKIAIENTNKNRQNAYRLSKKLQNNGFRVIDISHSKKKMDSAIYAQKGNTVEAKYVHNKLNLDKSVEVIAASMGSPIADITIVVGQQSLISE